ncbi:MAG: hypothetical protein C0621_08570 [Desulfuromonas sp.]|nr:MAG: hypothetical protein C0621_08570 [Desulfuromonas sp.]
MRRRRFEEEEEDLRPSRSAKKRAAEAVEETAKQLAELGEAEAQRLPLPQELREEYELLRRTAGRGSYKRQLKHFAGLLRRDDEVREELEAFLGGYHEQGRQERAIQHRLEQLRDQLIDPASETAAFADVEKSLSTVDLGELRRLVKQARAAKDRRPYREIFRRLRQAMED